MEYNKKIKIGIAVFFFVAALDTSCTYNKEELLYPSPPGCDTVPSFQGSVKIIINNKCAISGCHDEFASGGYTFQNYTQINSAKNNIKSAVVIQKIMPLTGTITPDEINQLRCWIDNGAPNN